MPVELRARRARPSYKTMFEFSGDEGGPPLADDASSESVFEPTYPEGDGQKDDEYGDDTMLQSDADLGLVPDDDLDSVPSKTKGKGKAVVTSLAPTVSLHRPTTAILAPGLSRPSARKNYALPLQSLNHRHRGIPIHLPPPQTLRLVNEPGIFTHAETLLTRSIADDEIRERVIKATGNNFGQGPVWELMEDRSWFKECTSGDQTRPTVYGSLRVEEDWELLSLQEASSYTPEGFDGSSSLTCFFGSTNGNQNKVKMKALDTHKLARFIPGGKSNVFFAGAPVWAIDWCPVFVDDLPCRNYKQYLAVAPFPSHSHSPEIGKRIIRPSLACIQIWSLSPTANNQTENTVVPDEPGIMKCELVLCIDGGAAYNLKWCPLPAHDKPSKRSSDSQPRKLGVLGGTFEDGSVSFYIVPDPDSLAAPGQASIDPFYVKLAPSLRIEFEDTLCWSMDWANSDLIAVGCTNGSVAIFHIQEALENASHRPPRPSHYFALHQSAIRSLSWVRVPPTSASGVLQHNRDPTVLVSGGYDGAQMVTDIRDLKGNVMNRTRDVINDIVFSHHAGGPISSDHENSIKSFGIAPSVLGRGHALLEPSGPVWSIAVSDFHSQIAVGSADGTCQTTNIMKSTRRGGAVPFFIHKIFQMDYNRTSGEYRMLQNFLPYEHQDRTAVSRATKTKKGEADQSDLPVGTGAWSPEVSVTCVSWQSGSGLARAPLLASATASGLCRVDWLLGRFAGNRFPYRNIQRLRGEVEAGEDDEEDEDE